MLCLRVIIELILCSIYQFLSLKLEFLYVKCRLYKGNPAGLLLALRLVGGLLIL